MPDEDWPTMQTQFARVGVKIDKWDACIGKQLTSDQLSSYLSTYAMASLERRVKLNKSDIISVGMVGCSLSHIHIWQHGDARGINMLAVFERDALLDPEFAGRYQEAILWAHKMLASGVEFDIGLLGYFDNGTAEWDSAGMSPSNPWYKMKRGSSFFGTHAYLVTASGMKKLCTYAFPLEQQIDRYISMMQSRGLQIYGLKHKIVTQNLHASTVQDGSNPPLLQFNNPLIFDAYDVNQVIKCKAHAILTNDGANAHPLQPFYDGWAKLFPSN